MIKEWVNPTLKRADEIINGERQDQYGDPEDSFKAIAEIWQWYLNFRADFGTVLNARDVSIMMSLFKHARLNGQEWNRDNATDACGYLAILNDRIMADKD